MRPSGPTSTRHAGFTLTELLIVILIIGVLISLLLPAVAGVRSTARKSSSTAFMSEIMSASSQFQAAERRLPGYFSVRQLANVNNYAQSKSSTTGGFTQMESALLDLAGGIDPDQTNAADTDDRIRVGPWLGDSTQSVYVLRSKIGAEDGPGYLALPEQFADLGGPNNGQVGNKSNRLMPDLIDAFGMPILMWQKDPLAAQGTVVICADKIAETSRFPAAKEGAGKPDPHFYLNTNCGMLHASVLGKESQKSQFNESCLAWGVPGPGATNTLADALRTLSAVVGHPAFPNQDSMGNIDQVGPIPAQMRGEVIVHSAGADGIYAKKRGQVITRYQYVPEGFDWSSSGAAGWMTGGELMDKLDDIILPGG